MKLKLEIEIEDGKVVSVKTVEPGKHIVEPFSDYARCFDSGCPGWTKDPESNLMFLRQQQLYANDLLRAKGHLFLNEVYDLLGFPRTKAGQVAGWCYNKKGHIGDNFVDFGIYSNHPANHDFVNGYERTVWLDFNVDESIIDVLEEKEEGEA